jgi:hypothetical protein
VIYISESMLCFYEQLAVSSNGSLQILAMTPRLIFVGVLQKFVNGTVTVQSVMQTILPQAQTGNLRMNYSFALNFAPYILV